MKNWIPIWLLGKLFMESYGESYADSYTCRRPLTATIEAGLKPVWPDPVKMNWPDQVKVLNGPWLDKIRSL
jgi:hypothetical protein